MHHSPQQEFDLEWDVESDRSEMEPLKLSLSYQPKGSYLIQVPVVSLLKMYHLHVSILVYNFPEDSSFFCHSGSQCADLEGKGLEFRV